MIAASSRALAETLSEEEVSSQCLMPEVSRLWEVCGHVALRVAEQAIADGIAEEIATAELVQKIDKYRWLPEYPEIITTDS